MLQLLRALAQAGAGPQSQAASKKERGKNLAGKVQYILMSSLYNHLAKKRRSPINPDRPRQLNSKASLQKRFPKLTWSCMRY